MKFSVVIPTFNRRHIIASAIDSVFFQDAGGLEVIVVDDGSTDGTVAWLGEAYAGRPVRVLRNDGIKGPAGGRNTGIRASKGALIAFLDSDDSFLPGHLKEADTAFKRFPGLDVVFGRARYERAGVAEDYMGPNFERKLALAPKVYADENLSLFGPEFFAHLLEYGCWFNLSTAVLRRNAAVELMNESLRISEDYEFWVRLSRIHQFACLHAPQIRYALHDENISFEAAGSVADHAPRLLEALRIMLNYPDLTLSQQRMIRRQMADVLFDWAYRSGQQRHLADAARLHWQSLRNGRRMENLAALLKLPLHAVWPRQSL